VETLTELQWIFDVLTGCGLLWLAWSCLSSRNLHRAVVQFVSFGLLMSLAWVRLEAPDIALAEAAIGAGLTGALLMASLARLPLSGSADIRALKSAERIAGARLLQLLRNSLLFAFALFIIYAIFFLPPEFSGLSQEVATEIENAGVRNPVTAVLLNFRGYDTFLELLVLLGALFGVRIVGMQPVRTSMTSEPVLNILASLLTPILILVAAYLLWIGTDGAGGAFQAGAVLGAGGVLLLLAGWRPARALMASPFRSLVLLGPLAFVFVAVLPLLSGRALLQYPPDSAGTLIVLLEIAATLSIGLTLCALFLNVSADDGEQP